MKIERCRKNLYKEVKKLVRRTSCISLSKEDFILRLKETRDKSAERAIEVSTRRLFDVIQYILHEVLTNATKDAPQGSPVFFKEELCSEYLRVLLENQVSNKKLKNPRFYVDEGERYIVFGGKPDTNVPESMEHFGIWTIQEMKAEIRHKLIDLDPEYSKIQTFVLLNFEKMMKRLDEIDFGKVPA